MSSPLHTEIPSSVYDSGILFSVPALFALYACLNVLIVSHCRSHDSPDQRDNLVALCAPPPRSSPHTSEKISRGNIMCGWLSKPQMVIIIETRK